MCYAIPGKIVKKDEKIVTIDYFGEKKQAINELSTIEIGDYIYAQGGYVIEKINKNEAEQILAVWKETFFELQKADLFLSRLEIDKKNKDKKLLAIFDKVLGGKNINKDDAIYLLSLKDKDSLSLFYKTANFLRQKFLKNSCCVHGIIEISNYCTAHCKYCGISLYNKSLKRYRMSVNEVIQKTIEVMEIYGFKSIVLQSGEDRFYSIEDLANIIKGIKQVRNALIIISFGEIGLEGLEELYNAGARGILLRFETSNPQLYKEIHKNKNLTSRISHLKKAKELGYLIFTGGLVGLPGQTTEDIVNDIFLAKELDTEMYSFGPFIPHPETPLKDIGKINIDDMLKVISLIRLLDYKNGKIVVTTAFETLNKEARKRGLMAGANSLMLNATPINYRQLYDLYPHRKYKDTELETQIEETISFLRSIGRAPTDLGI